jgi:hypothetical protein
MEVVIFIVGVFVMMMVVGGCFLTMMVSFASEKQSADE